MKTAIFNSPWMKNDYFVAVDNGQKIQSLPITVIANFRLHMKII